MGLWNLLTQWFPGRGHGVDELARRLDVTEESLRAVQPAYQAFIIPKRSGGERRILAPSPELKKIQRRILRRLLDRLRCHPAVTGFQPGQSIVTNALPHVGKAVVLRMDLKSFFESTSARRIGAYFRFVGWNREAAGLLVKLCTWQGSLPQGAPTSPRLSNLVNYRLDVRLANLAPRTGTLQFRNPRTGEKISKVISDAQYRMAFTRYADDLTFSFNFDDAIAIRTALWHIRQIVNDEGYALHMRKKLQIRRRHARQLVTGLVVNERIQLPRETRRWLRAVEHRATNGRKTTLSPLQLEGWRALQRMIAEQSGDKH